MDRLFKCAGCNNKFEITKLIRMPGETIVQPDGFTFDTGQNYCQACFDQQTKDNILLKDKGKKIKETEIDGITQVKDVLINTNVNLLADIKRKISEKTNEKGLRIGEFKIGDESGDIILVLWNELVDLIKEGDKIHLIRGYVREWNGEKRITKGKQGIIKKM